jgi:hypothetical protein
MRLNKNRSFGDIGSRVLLLIIGIGIAQSKIQPTPKIKSHGLWNLLKEI